MNATNNNTVNASANEVSKSTNLVPLAKTQRVLETRDQWAVIYNHTVALVVAHIKGEALPSDPRKGFAFGSTKDAPHCRGYAQSLIGGFVSRKAGKVFAQTEGLKEQADREKIAIAILVATKLGTSDTGKAKAILSKAEPKQARSFAEAVLAALNEVQKTDSAPEVAPKEQKPKKTTSRKRASK